MTRSVRAAFVLALALSLACLTACGGGGGDEISPPLTRPPEPALHGQCGQAVNQCDAGLFADLADSDTAHQWQCGGSNGGATACLRAAEATTTARSDRRSVRYNGQPVSDRSVHSPNRH